MIKNDKNATVSGTPGIQSIESISEKIAACQTSYDTLRLMREVATAYDFKYFAIGRLPHHEAATLARLYIINNWPPELIRDYDDLGLLGSSPLLETLKTSTKPISWLRIPTRNERPDSRVKIAAELFDKFDITYSILFPTQDLAGIRGAVSFSGSRGALNDTETLELAFFSNMVYEKATSLHASPYAPKQALSGRELECLQWTANGKTSGEIAALLGLSEHTVNHYLAGAGQKLGAVNRTHAVAMALRANLLG